ncbi:MAG: alanine racemase [Oscillospiraceae bacterium]|nr:alanine racemase [Oscillospiraceae bacterium]
MYNNTRPVWVEVNLDNIEYNLRNIQRIVKNKEIIAVVKADAYGHGAVDVAHVLSLNGITRFAVAVVTEAVELRRSGIKSSILVLGYTPPSLYHMLLKYDIEQTVFDYDTAFRISDLAKRWFKNVKIHIKVDTGMGRLGFLYCEESFNAIYNISKLPCLQIEGIYSHFSSADESDNSYTLMQLERFNDFCLKINSMGIEYKIRHISNSAGILNIPESIYDAVRPGLSLYGYYPSLETKRTIELRPALCFKSTIIYLKDLPKGEYISYGRLYRTKTLEKIATLPFGYADGFSRLLNNKASVIIKNKKVPIVGSICMDQCMANVDDVPDAKVGDEVIIIGESESEKITIEDLAKSLSTINYEVLCMITKRVPRIYLRECQIVKVRNYV